MKSLVALLIVLISGFAHAESLENLKLELGLSDQDTQLSLNSKAHNLRPIIIAIVDDAFDPGAAYLNGMLWNNPKEISNNQKDDDGNGYIDDVNGWDTADMNEILTPPTSRQSEFNHGLYTTGLIAELIRLKLGERDDYPIKLMLVKSVSDQAQSLTMQGGYVGLDYAVSNNADIVSNAWSGGGLNDDARNSLNTARNKGIFIVNSLGNFPSPEVSFPAAHPAVFGVAGVNRIGELSLKSNYGQEADLATLADDISGPDWNNTSQRQSGTSVSAPIVAATAALMKLSNRHISKQQIARCLKASAKPIDEVNPLIPAKLGAGLLQVDAAIDCAKDPLEFLHRQIGKIHKAEGAIGVSRAGKYHWSIQPNGGVAAIRLKSKPTPYADAEITISNQEILYQGHLSELPKELEVAGDKLNIELNANNTGQVFKWSAEFESTLIDLEKRYCSGRTELEKRQASAININSGNGKESYATNTDCQWLIPHHVGKSTRIDFNDVDLADGDTVYIFNGDNTEQRNLLASLTGTKSPPSILVKGSSVLLWFLSDKTGEGRGFNARVTWE